MTPTTREGIDGLISNNLVYVNQIRPILYGLLNCCVRCSETTITSAQVLALHTTPVELIAAQGAGTVIFPIAATVYIPYVSKVYATDVGLRFKLGTFLWDDISSALGSGGVYLLLKELLATGGGGGGAYPTITNAPFYLTTPTANPTAGDSPVKINMLYWVITL